MSAVDISVQGLTPEIIEAYQSMGMDRSKQGREAISWLFARGEEQFSVARVDGHIVGMSANICHSMKFSAHSGVGYQAVDSFVDKSMRGQGLFGMMASTFKAHLACKKGDLVWGFPNDNAASIWFGKQGWVNHGQAPFLFKPLRAGYLLRKLNLPGDFALSSGRNQRLNEIHKAGPWADVLWDKESKLINCATHRNSSFLNWRLFAAPHSKEYRVVANENEIDPCLLATRVMDKHEGRIAYVMEAMGAHTELYEMLTSELARLRDGGSEIALAWSFPWSPNYKALRKAGFLPLPNRLRPIRIWFGGSAITPRAEPFALLKGNYLSYLDSDTV